MLEFVNFDDIFGQDTQLSFFCYGFGSFLVGEFSPTFIPSGERASTFL